MHRLIYLVALVLTGMIWISPVRGEAPNAMFTPPATNIRDIGPAGQNAIKEYGQEVMIVFDALDKLIQAPPKDPDQARIDFEKECDGILECLAGAREICEQHAGDKGLSEPYDSWFNSQEAAWRYIRSSGGSAVVLLSYSNAQIKAWESSWIPGLKVKKKDYRKQAKDLNKAYNDLVDAVENRGTNFNAEVLREKVERFNGYVHQAGVLGRALIDYKKLLDVEVIIMNPAHVHDKIFAQTVAELTSPTIVLPSDQIFPFMLQTWGQYLQQRWDELLKWYDLSVTASASIRAETVFRTESKPLQGLKYSKIHPTFANLQKVYSSVFGDIKIRKKKEEERWEKDRKKILQLIRRCGADINREHRLAMGRADGPLKNRQLKIDTMKFVGLGEYLKLYRQLVGDPDGLSEKERRKRETPEFKKIWAERERMAKEYVAAQVKEMEDNALRTQKNYDEFLRICDEDGKEIERIMKENEKRREKLGMYPRPFYKK